MSEKVKFIKTILIITSFLTFLLVSGVWLFYRFLYRSKASSSQALVGVVVGPSIGDFNPGILGQATSPFVDFEAPYYLTPAKVIKPGFVRFSDKTFLWKREINGVIPWYLAHKKKHIIVNNRGQAEFSVPSSIFQEIPVFDLKSGEQKIFRGQKLKLRFNYATFNYNPGDFESVFRLLYVYADTNIYGITTPLIEESLQPTNGNWSIYEREVTYNPDPKRPVTMLRLIFRLDPKNTQGANSQAKLVIDNVSLNVGNTSENLVRDGGFDITQFPNYTNPREARARLILTPKELDRVAEFVNKFGGKLIFSISPNVITPHVCSDCSLYDMVLGREEAREEYVRYWLPQWMDVVGYLYNRHNIRYFEFGFEPEIWWADINPAYNVGIGDVRRTKDRYKLYGEMYAYFAVEAKRRYPEIKLGAYILPSVERWKASIDGFFEGIEAYKNNSGNRNVPLPDFWTPHTYLAYAWGEGNCKMGNPPSEREMKHCVNLVLSEYGQGIYCDLRTDEIKLPQGMSAFRADQTHKFQEAFFQCSESYLKKKTQKGDIEFILTEWGMSGSTFRPWDKFADEVFTADMLGRYAKLGLSGAAHFVMYLGHGIINQYGKVNPPFTIYKLYQKYLNRGRKVRVLQTQSSNPVAVTAYAYEDEGNLYLFLINKEIENNKEYEVEVNFPNINRLELTKVRSFRIECDSQRDRDCLYHPNSTYVNGRRAEVSYLNSDKAYEPEVINLRDGKINLLPHSVRFLIFDKKSRVTTPTPTPTPTLTPTPTPTPWIQVISWKGRDIRCRGKEFNSFSVWEISFDIRLRGIAPGGVKKVVLYKSTKVNSNQNFGNWEKIAEVNVPSALPSNIRKEPVKVYTYKVSVPKNLNRGIREIKFKAEYKGTNISDITDNPKVIFKEGENNDIIDNICKITSTRSSVIPTFYPLSPTRSVIPTPIQTININSSPQTCAKDKGDANCDGKIDIADYSIWLGEFRKGCSSNNNNEGSCLGDADGDGKLMDAVFDKDGVVNMGDYYLWYQSYSAQ